MKKYVKYPRSTPENTPGNVVDFIDELLILHILHSILGRTCGCVRQRVEYEKYAKYAKMPLSTCAG